MLALGTFALDWLNVPPKGRVMINLRREKSIRLVIGQRERLRMLLWLLFWLVGIPVGMIGYLSMLLWAYGVAG